MTPTKPHYLHTENSCKSIRSKKSDLPACGQKRVVSPSGSRHCKDRKKHAADLGAR